ncbi:MAG: alpha/beta fold hydrolase [Myxococcaceae bacterium]
MDRPGEAGIQHRYIEVGDVTLHCAMAGSGPLVVLLHGFPEFWYCWRNQLPALAEAGFRAVAPDLRGYNLSSKPEGLRAYALGPVAKDIARLIPALGHTRAAVVGHDWGGAVAWALAMGHPERVSRLAALAAPHPLAFLKMLRSPFQWLRSSYFLMFQLPWLPESLLATNDFALLRQGLLRAGRGALQPEELERYVTAWTEPGALHCGLQYYRAALRVPPDALKTIEAPVRVMFGQEDPFLARDAATPPKRWVTQAEVEILPGAGHFLPWEAHERVTPRLLEFLRPALNGA